MQVKIIHFIPQVPGLPVYEMQDGTLRLPFAPKKEKHKIFFWASEAEMTKGVSDHNRLIELRHPFAEAYKEIQKQKREPKPITGINDKVVAIARM